MEEMLELISILSPFFSNVYFTYVLKYVLVILSTYNLCL